MTQHVQACFLREPEADAIPLVCDSPHSGTDYPDDFGAAIPRECLRAGEDSHVDVLWSAGPCVGATLLAARFPRTYIDPNRTLEDLDPDMLATRWPRPLTPGPKVRLGFGLIWRNIDASTPVYARKLSVAEVQHRIDCYYKPYHAALEQAIDAAHARFGNVWHLNLHSMPGNAYARLGLDASRPLADFVLGDCDGSTCEAAFVALVERELRAIGYTVARNDPYKGAQIVAQIGQPAQGRHSLQIEIRRSLYMDEKTREPHAGFRKVQRHLTIVLQKIAARLRAQVQ